MRIDLLSGAFGVLLAFSGVAAASERPIRLELNRLEAQGQSCRTYLLIENKSSDAYKSLRLDLFVLDGGGVAARRLAVEAAPLAANKTIIRLFDIPGIACESIGSVLLNDVATCETDAPGENCARLVETSSRANVPFVK